VKNTSGYELGSSAMIYGGYGSLIQYLGESLSDGEIIMNTTVTAITVVSNESNTSVVINTSDGQTFTSSHVIVTVPLGVLKTDMITFDPPLPDEKRSAIDRTDWGVVEKIVLSFNTTFWRSFPDRFSNIIYVPDYYPNRFPVLIDNSDTAGSPTLTAIVTADVSVELSINPDQIVEEIQDILITMFPESYEAPIGVTNSSWLNDPFCKGSYMVEGTNFLVGDIDLIAAPAHDERVLFAGDSTHNKYNGYVGGAMLSGLREADRIIRKRT